MTIKENKKRKPNGYWTTERCIAEAGKYGAKEAFKKGSGSAYQASHKFGLLDDLFENVNKTWTEATVLEEASKYTSQAQLRKYANNCYKAAARLGVLKALYAYTPVTTADDNLWTQGLKTCSVCEEVKPADQYGKHKGGSYGLRAMCKACRAAYRVTTREARAAYQKNYYEDNKALLVAHSSINSARKRSGLEDSELFGGGTFQEAVVWTMPFVEQRLKLQEETGELHHIDHIVPLKAGGLHVPSNLQVLTAKANTEKLLEDMVLVSQYKEEQSH